MILGNSNSFFTQHGNPVIIPDFALSPLNFAFPSHPQFQLMADCLIRQNTHDLLLYFPYAKLIQIPFIESFLAFLRNSSFPKKLAQAEMLLLDIDINWFSTQPSSKIEQDVEHFIQSLSAQDKFLIIILSETNWLHESHAPTRFLKSQFKRLFAHPKLRVIGFTETKTAPLPFQLFKIDPPTADEGLTIIKNKKYELEKFHHVKITQDIVTESYAFVERFMGNQAPPFVFNLLDSSAGRIAPQQANEIKVLQQTDVWKVLSDWTQISPEKIKSAGDLSQELKNKILGQTLAINELTKAQENHDQKLFLFVGPENTGKKLTARHLTASLFGNDLAFYETYCDTVSVTTWEEILFYNAAGNECYEMQELLALKPFAVLLFKNIECLPEILFKKLSDFIKRYSLDPNESPRATLIFSTTVGAHALNTFSKSIIAEITHNQTQVENLLVDIDPNDCYPMSDIFTPVELIECIIPDLKKRLPKFFYERLCIIPFLPLSPLMIEKIIHQHLNQLKTEVAHHHQVVLVYAPEIVDYLINEAMPLAAVVEGTNKIPQTLKKLHEMIDEGLKTRNSQLLESQLFLQLNDTGQQLHFVWEESLVGT